MKNNKRKISFPSKNGENMRKNKKMNKQILIILIFIVIVIIIFIGTFLLKKPSENLEDIVINNKNHWYIFDGQNYYSSGSYQGFMYLGKGIDDLTPDEITVLFLYYYINNNEFFTDTNKINDTEYQKIISYEDAGNIIYKMFGPDTTNNKLLDLSFGCGNKIELNEDNIIITSKEQNSCLPSINTVEEYKTYITGYEKDEDNILISLKVAFLSNLGNNNQYIIYDEKSKEMPLGEFSKTCFQETSKNCYSDFNDYIVTLKKASDNNYYFKSIKQK